MASKEMKPGMIPIQMTPISAVSTDPAMYITYIGSSAYADVEVNAGGDLLLKHGTSDSTEAADTTVGSPNLDGTFDLSTPAAAVNTFGELVDLINNSPNWRARLGSMKRSDLTDNSLITKSQTAAKGVEVSLLHDTTQLATATLYIVGAAVGHGTLLGPEQRGWRTCITRIEGIGTSAGAHTLAVYSCNPYTKEETLVFTGTVASATAYEYNDVDFGALGGIYSKPGEYLLVQHQADTATITSPRLQIQGFHEPMGASAPQTAFISAMA